MDKKVYETVEAGAMGRVSMGVMESEIDFFAGAMAAFNAMGVPDGEAMPPKWVLPIMSGRSILPEVK